MRLPRNVGIATGAYELERDDWDAAVARAALGRWPFLELTAIRWERLQTLVAFLDRGGNELEHFERVSVQDRFGGRLRQVHLSGIDADGTHRPTTAADWSLYAQLLDRCGDVPWLLETVLASPADT